MIDYNLNFCLTAGVLTKTIQLLTTLKFLQVQQQSTTYYCCCMKKTKANQCVLLQFNPIYVFFIVSFTQSANQPTTQQTNQKKSTNKHYNK